MDPKDAAAAVVAMTFILSGGAVLIFRGALGKAIARRIEGKAGADPVQTDRIEELEHRLAALEQERARVGELEERLDFAERLLAQRRDAERLPGG